eukprot:s2692_g9.t1
MVTNIEFCALGRVGMSKDQEQAFNAKHAEPKTVNGLCTFKTITKKTPAKLLKGVTFVFAKPRPACLIMPRRSVRTRFWVHPFCGMTQDSEASLEEQLWRERRLAGDQFRHARKV